jgi:hypothetical protein
MSKNRQARRKEAAQQKRNQPGQAKRALRPREPKRSPLPGQQAARALDPNWGLREALFEIAKERGDWAGIPMPISGERLIIEPSFPNAAKLMEIGQKSPDADDGWRLVNQWYSNKHRCDILLMRGADGKLDWGKAPAFHHISHDISTLGCSDAWGIEQEHRATILLGEMLRHRQLKQYLMTGMFIETSKRSGITYIFRRLKPTVALSPRGAGASMKILCSLCMHPIAYYAGSWAGAMCPTDDVIAHLALMRGDEHMFWKRCNQHPPYRPEAGL